jgi:L-threonylcarbamoyladenylate synthase
MSPSFFSAFQLDSQGSFDPVQWLSQGGVLGMPTETVYGLAARADHLQAIEQIYRLKNRPSHNPLIIHYADLECLEQDVFFHPLAYQIAKILWPGPLTMLLEKKEISRVVPQAHCFLPCLAVRIPSHPVARALLRQTGPLAAPSANLSGYLSPTQSAHVIEAFEGRVPVLEGGPCHVGLESTILDARRPPFRILRRGCLTLESLQRQFPHIGFEEGACSVRALPSEIHETGSHDTEFHETPGSSLAHYAPRKPLRANAMHVDTDEGLIGFGPPFAQPKAFSQLSWSGDLEEAARNFFSALHTLDASPHCQRIAVMPLPSQGIGKALHDRLLRACYGAVISSKYSSI